MSEAQVRFQAAECWNGCDDRHCPYIHISGWFHGDDGPYETCEAAIAKATERSGTHATGE